jgi:hypothetical protein
MDIRELLNHIRAGSSNRQIAHNVKVDRRTVQRYRQWAEDQGLLAGPLPELGDLVALLGETMPGKQPPQNVSSVEPYRDVIDNLKAAIIKAVWDDPEVQQSYRECAEHYGFLIAPCRPRTPEHKGKVEKGGVHYVKRNFLGGREPTTITQANRDVLVWCDTTAGLRTHGKTKEQPLARFEETKRDRLQPHRWYIFGEHRWWSLGEHRWYIYVRLLTSIAGVNA